VPARGAWLPDRALLGGPRGLWTVYVLVPAVAGAIAFQVLPRQEDPTLPQVFGAMHCLFPGDADAARIESLVTEPIETRLREVAEVKTITSRSQLGAVRYRVELFDTVDEPHRVRARIRSILVRARDRPAARRFGARAGGRDLRRTRLVALTWSHHWPPRTPILQQLAKELRLRLANLPGTQETKLFGDAEEEILVSVDPASKARSRICR